MDWQDMIPWVTHPWASLQILGTRQLPDIQVTWRPAQRFLHYQALYRGVYEYLRSPPDIIHFSRAVRYLRVLQACYHPSNTLQQHRILWTQSWLDELDYPENSDAETVVSPEDSVI
jgi:hypothetical protein